MCLIRIVAPGCGQRSQGVGSYAGDALDEHRRKSEQEERCDLRPSVPPLFLPVESEQQLKRVGGRDPRVGATFLTLFRHL